MDEPYISKNFDMDDIRRLRDYNSSRYMKMTHEEILDDIQKDANEMIKLLDARKKEKQLAIH